MKLNLRDALLSSLTTLPGTREFHLHVLISAPRKHNSLYPYSSPRQRSYLQDIIILLSEQQTPDSPRLFVAAVEACVYNIPSTSSGILYISKVDSTGQGLFPSAVGTLVKSLICYYAEPHTRPIAVDHMWVQLFARAQNQYLFANSSEHPKKRPLSDTKLCAWWKGILSSAVTEMQAKTAQGEHMTKIRMFYLLPGYNELEAVQSLNSKVALDASISWTYGHPYSQPDLPLPGPISTPLKNLGEYIPSYEDDPKSRFMDEIACTTTVDGVKSPERKRSKRVHPSSSQANDTKSTKADSHAPEQLKSTTVSDEGHAHASSGELSRVTPDEFWERMSFRQECVTGAVTGFFTVVISCCSSSGTEGSGVGTQQVSGVSPLAPQPGQVSSQMNKRVMASLLTSVEFSNLERSIKATETIEGLIKGLCEGLSTLPPPIVRTRPPPSSSSRDQRTPEPEDRPTLLAPPQTPPPRARDKAKIEDSISPNPFDDPEPSLETYRSYIYGSVFVKNAELAKAPIEAAKTQQQPITILAVRKKKKRTEG